MGKKPVQYLRVLLLSAVIICSHVSAHSPSAMDITYDSDLNSILVSVTHRVNDLSFHYVNEIVLRKNGGITDSFTYTSQPTTDNFTYRYLMPLQGGDTMTVTAKCNVGGAITREYTYPGHAIPATTPSRQPSKWSYSSLWPIHAALMTAGFLCFLVSALLPVFGKQITGWYRLHSTVSGAGAFLTILALGISLVMVSLSGGPHFRVFHAYLGILIIVVLMLVLGLAFIRRSTSIDRKVVIRILHLWLGRLLVILLLANIFMGLNVAGLL